MVFSIFLFQKKKNSSEPMSTSLLRFTKITAGFSRTLSLSVTSLGPKGKKPKKGGKGGGGKNVTVEPLKAETVRIRVPQPYWQIMENSRRNFS